MSMPSKILKTDLTTQVKHLILNGLMRLTLNTGQSRPQTGWVTGMVRLTILLTILTFNGRLKTAKIL